jgi:hypothetical protein
MPLLACGGQPHCYNFCDCTYPGFSARCDFIAVILGMLLVPSGLTLAMAWAHRASVLAAVQEALNHNDFQGLHRNNDLQSCIFATNSLLTNPSAAKSFANVNPTAWTALYGFDTICRQLSPVADADAAPSGLVPVRDARAGVHDAGEFPIHNDGLGWDGRGCQVKERGSQKTTPPVHLSRRLHSQPFLHILPIKPIRFHGNTHWSR